MVALTTDGKFFPLLTVDGRSRLRLLSGNLVQKLKKIFTFVLELILTNEC